MEDPTPERVPVYTQMFQGHRMHMYGDRGSTQPHFAFGDLRAMRGRQVFLNDTPYIVDPLERIYVPESVADIIFPTNTAFRTWRAQAATDFALA